jgi:hypothetical protein
MATAASSGTTSPPNKKSPARDQPRGARHNGERSDMSNTEYQDTFDQDMEELRALADTVFGALDFLQGADREWALGNLRVVEALFELGPVA